MTMSLYLQRLQEEKQGKKNGKALPAPQSLSVKAAHADFIVPCNVLKTTRVLRSKESWANPIEITPHTPREESQT